MANQSGRLPCLGQTFLHRITNHAPMHCTQTVSAPSLTVPTATAHILRRLNKRPRHLVASASRSPGLSRLALARLLLRFPHGTQSVFFTTMCNFLFTFSAAHYTITVPPCPCSSRLRALKQNKKNGPPDEPSLHVLAPPPRLPLRMQLSRPKHGNQGFA